MEWCYIMLYIYIIICYIITVCQILMDFVSPGFGQNSWSLKAGTLAILNTKPRASRGKFFRNHYFLCESISVAFAIYCFPAISYVQVVQHDFKIYHINLDDISCTKELKPSNSSAPSGGAWSKAKSSQRPQIFL